MPTSERMERVRTQFGDVGMGKDNLQEILRQRHQGQITPEEADRRWMAIASPRSQSRWYRFWKMFLVKGE